MLFIISNAEIKSVKLIIKPAHDKDFIIINLYKICCILKNFYHCTCSNRWTEKSCSLVIDIKNISQCCLQFQYEMRSLSGNSFLQIKNNNDYFSSLLFEVIVASAQKLNHLGTQTKHIPS